MRDRTAIGVTLTQIGRELGVRPNPLRRWARFAKERDTSATPAGEEVVTLAEVREVETLRQERNFAKQKSAQYRSAEYRALLTAHGLEASMSRRGNCWDNAVTESFFATLKGELVSDVDWATREEARDAIFEFIEIWYNRERRHSSLGYRTAVEYEQMLEAKPRRVRRTA